LTSQYPVQAAWSIDVDVAALKMTQALLRVEARPTVQQAAVVEHYQISGVQQEADLEFRGPQ
jgi:hypothetical protein